jgi:hypothetical protein
VSAPFFQAITGASAVMVMWNWPEFWMGSLILAAISGRYSAMYEIVVIEEEADEAYEWLYGQISRIKRRRDDD